MGVIETTFGKELKRLRGRLTLRELGQATNMDYVLLNKIELGLRLPPPLEGIIAIADALRLKPEELELLIDLAAKDNGKAGSRFTDDQVKRIKDSQSASVFFTRRAKND
jgi:transcriptional regulator with XRE-family HTH domain